MGTPELTRSLKHAATIVFGLTAVGAIAAVIAPSLASSTRPHPTLTGSLADGLSILANNLRLLGLPFLLWVLRFADSRLGRMLGDLTVSVMVAISTVTVGIALGRWRVRLIPYLPHLPLEWAALTVAVATWLLIRTGHAHIHQLLALGSTVAVLLFAAAALETWATPHRRISPPTRRAHGFIPARSGRLIVPPDCAGATLPGPSACPSPTAVAALVRRPIDGTPTTTDPQGGITA